MEYLNTLSMSADVGLQEEDAEANERARLQEKKRVRADDSQKSQSAVYPEKCPLEIW